MDPCLGPTARWVPGGERSGSRLVDRCGVCWSGLGLGGCRGDRGRAAAGLAACSGVSTCSSGNCGGPAPVPAVGSRCVWAVSAQSHPGSHGPPGGGPEDPSLACQGPAGLKSVCCSPHGPCGPALTVSPGLGHGLLGHKRHPVPWKNDLVVWLEGCQEPQRSPSLCASCRPPPGAHPVLPGLCFPGCGGLAHPALFPARPGDPSPVLDSRLWACTFAVPPVGPSLLRARCTWSRQDGMVGTRGWVRACGP